MKRITLASSAITLLLSSAAQAQDGEAKLSFGASSDGASADASASGEAKGDAPTAAAGEAERPVGKDIPYMKRYVPEANMWELGLFGGVMFPSKSHELYDPNRPGTQQAFKAALDIGARIAYFPASFLGLEFEGAGLPSKVEDGSRGGLAALRGHLVFQVPGSSITPFLTAGGGFIAGDSDAMGSDIDPSLNLGLGVKAALDEHISLRLDVRDNLSQKFEADQGALTHHPEILLGLTFVPTRRKPDYDGDKVNDFRDPCPRDAGENGGCPVQDNDKDGVPNETDQCPDVASTDPSGCPPVECKVKDTDGDGVTDSRDACPDEAAETVDGCPIKDADGDGLFDDKDKCPTEAAKTEDGCPVRDADGDGILDDADKCANEPETVNGFEDKDGCPDVVPEKVKKFSGVMKGIQFDFGSAKVAKASEATLREAVAVMQEFPSLRIEISGHTDSTGDAETNKKLSQERADSVKKFMVDAGIDGSRLETVGHGPDKPIADNATPAGRTTNRRIEFRLLGE